MCYDRDKARMVSNINQFFFASVSTDLEPLPEREVDPYPDPFPDSMVIPTEFVEDQLAKIKSSKGSRAR